MKCELCGGLKFKRVEKGWMCEDCETIYSQVEKEALASKGSSRVCYVLHTDAQDMKKLVDDLKKQNEELIEQEKSKKTSDQFAHLAILWRLNSM